MQREGASLAVHLPGLALVSSCPCPWPWGLPASPSCPPARAAGKTQHEPRFHALKLVYWKLLAAGFSFFIFSFLFFFKETPTLTQQANKGAPCHSPAANNHMHLKRGFQAEEEGWHCIQWSCLVWAVVLTCSDKYSVITPLCLASKVIISQKVATVHYFW